MSDAPLVYIIVLNWNRPRLTLDCLESLRSLDYPNYRVLVVDNGSTDESVAKIRAAFPSIEIVETGENLGFAGGNNKGIERALENGAEFVWLLNNDTCVFSDTLNALVASAIEDPRIGAVGSVLLASTRPDVVLAWGGGNVNMWAGRATHTTEAIHMTTRTFLSAASILLRRQALESAGFLDAGFFMYWEDVDLSFRIRKAGYRLVVAPAARLLHFECSTLTKQNPLLVRYSSQSLVRFFQRHSPLPWIPIGCALASRMFKKIVLGRWQDVAATVQGARNGFRQLSW